MARTASRTRGRSGTAAAGLGAAGALLAAGRLVLRHPPGRTPGVPRRIATSPAPRPAVTPSTAPPAPDEQGSGSGSDGGHTGPFSRTARGASVALWLATLAMVVGAVTVGAGAILLGLRPSLGVVLIPVGAVVGIGGLVAALRLHILDDVE